MKYCFFFIIATGISNSDNFDETTSNAGININTNDVLSGPIYVGCFG